MASTHFSVRQLELDKILRRVAELERKLASGAVTVQKPAEPAEPVEPIKPDSAAEPVVPEKPQPPQPPQASSEPQTQTASMFKLWPEALLILKETCKPLSGLLVGSSAYVSGNTLRIKSNNAAFAQFLAMPLYANAIRSAVEKVSGNSMHIEPFDTQAEDKKSDPLENLIRKIDTLQ